MRSVLSIAMAQHERAKEAVMSALQDLEFCKGVLQQALAKEAALEEQRHRAMESTKQNEIEHLAKVKAEEQREAEQARLAEEEKARQIAEQRAKYSKTRRIRRTSNE